MQLLTAKAVTALGDEASKNFYLWTTPTDKFPEGRKDDTHLNREGALLFAKLAAQQIRLLDNSLAKEIKNQISGDLPFMVLYEEISIVSYKNEYRKLSINGKFLKFFPYL